MFMQQGDILIKKINELPKELTKDIPKNGKWIIAEGEHTGHIHAIAEKEAIVYKKDGKKYILTEEGFMITHQEHKEIVVTPGIYEIDFVKEFDPLLNKINSVRD